MKRQIVVKSKEDANRLTAEIRDRGIIILYFANFCSHCIAFRPVWEEFKRSCQISAAECEWNDIKVLPDHLTKVRLFPTIVYKQGAKTVEYNGDRSISSLHEFVSRSHVVKPAKPEKPEKSAQQAKSAKSPTKSLSAKSPRKKST